jgi:hypothetical protein
MPQMPQYSGAQVPQFSAGKDIFGAGPQGMFSQVLQSPQMTPQAGSPSGPKSQPSQDMQWWQMPGYTK